MIEADRMNLTAIAGGELNRRHEELYSNFQRRQHRVRPGGLDLTTLLLIDFLATEGAAEVGPPAPPAKASKGSKGKQQPEKKTGMRASSTRGDAGDDEPPEPPEHSYEEQAVDFKSIKKGTKVWVLSDNGPLDGEFEGRGRNGRVNVKIGGRREAVDPEAVRIATTG